ncbi:hypothetical protein XO10_09550 [Marinitoga sp. 1135]|uniref:peptidylprolyl isomerase n=1 Tax=Marinitoga piezophila (strain DSM 14283 / JCM 11233 / KA3) TaxID=443254 RepID=H2J6N1_MARPK|nr:MULTISPECIES: peptidyl-prolyl cis-trans isomerase [Marinitoga]AEX86312.1 hypothetical protein Marpi_1932 [Marinitoga piezophila KA3]APT76715.1 hypothetical protein LN42_10240 [Marinitoga sp. 1137]NUU96494.1 hypothetical protein [Marinitoga sp. 1135]NUU98413.1 hypothetical protein [Marinitoga sp. 1138]
MKKGLLILMMIVFAIVSVFGVVSYQELEDKTIVKINGEAVNYDYFQSQAKTLELLRGINNLNGEFYKVLVGSKEGNQTIQKYEKMKLDKLSGEILFIQFTEKEKGINLEKEELFNSISNDINNVFKSSGLSEDKIKLYLLSKGFENKEQYIYSIYHEKLYKKAISAIYQYLLENVEVSDEEIKAEYEANKDSYYSPQRATLDLILFKTSEEASLVYQKIIDGYYTYDDVYKTKLESSEATSLTISLEDNTNDLVNQIKSSFPGAILKPMKYSGSIYSLIKIEKKYPKRSLTIDEAKERIINKLKDEKAKKLFDKLVAEEFEKFKSNSTVIINSKYFKGDESNGKNN